MDSVTYEVEELKGCTIRRTVEKRLHPPMDCGSGALHMPQIYASLDNMVAAIALHSLLDERHPEIGGKASILTDGPISEATYSERCKAGEGVLFKPSKKIKSLQSLRIRHHYLPSYTEKEVPLTANPSDQDSGIQSGLVQEAGKVRIGDDTCGPYKTGKGQRKEYVTLPRQIPELHEVKRQPDFVSACEKHLIHSPANHRTLERAATIMSRQTLPARARQKQFHRELPISIMSSFEYSADQQINIAWVFQVANHLEANGIPVGLMNRCLFRAREEEDQLYMDPTIDLDVSDDLLKQAVKVLAGCGASVSSGASESVQMFRRDSPTGAGPGPGLSHAISVR
ncbi:uncharacterized protein BO97DRAFT_415458 [Aspergillus homomorphus CBS 101889]|uniref:Uncharacterized protein n=1 Tax=Aspergillus homomorphus (strain CBS 101889) TaxID=1450537 RepID=A0A395HXI3_ASPHC|nr:hypothetical protein BO97DRAFT_415458 [Aspergillus homomorphus CBS 101889]RAL10954.1 hypothetical protein BO97DRAFT_415458 [Aspergillus homomorphus CBS 101889]